jgi:hypothetical protein
MHSLVTPTGGVPAQSLPLPAQSLAGTVAQIIEILRGLIAHLAYTLHQPAPILKQFLLTRAQLIAGPRDACGSQVVPALEQVLTPVLTGLGYLLQHFLSLPGLSALRPTQAASLRPELSGLLLDTLGLLF